MCVGDLHCRMQGQLPGQAGVLSGAKHVTIAATGVLLEETSAAQLEVRFCMHLCEQ